MNIGFTGTRHGMTQKQRIVVAGLLQEMAAGISGVTHGDCIGADDQFHDLVRRLLPNALITARPGVPLKSKYRANCPANFIMALKSPLERNADIVDDGDRIIAAPREMKRQRRGGTWSTVRIADCVLKPLAIVWPDGTVTKERWP